MPDKLYDRTTRICDLESLRPDHRTALREHMEKYNLGAIDATFCAETTSVKRKGGFIERILGSKQTITYTSVVITPVWFLWVVSSDTQGATALSARLSEIEVSDYDPRLTLDRGLDVRARPTDASEFGSYFIGLSDEQAGSQMRAAILEAVKAAHSP